MRARRAWPVSYVRSVTGRPDTPCTASARSMISSSTSGRRGCPGGSKTASTVGPLPLCSPAWSLPRPRLSRTDSVQDGQGVARSPACPLLARLLELVEFVDHSDEDQKMKPEPRVGAEESVEVGVLELGGVLDVEAAVRDDQLLDTAPAFGVGGEGGDGGVEILDSLVKFEVDQRRTSTWPDLPHPSPSSRSWCRSGGAAVSHCEPLPGMPCASPPSCEARVGAALRNVRQGTPRDSLRLRAGGDWERQPPAKAVAQAAAMIAPHGHRQYQDPHGPSPAGGGRARTFPAVACGKCCPRCPRRIDCPHWPAAAGPLERGSRPSSSTHLAGRQER